MRDTVTDCRAFSGMCDLTKQYFVFIMSFFSKLPSSAPEGHAGCLCALVICRTSVLLVKRKEDKNMTILSFSCVFIVFYKLISVLEGLFVVATVE